MFEFLRVVFVLIIILTTALWYRYNRRNLPPGPSGLPLIGCLLRLGERPQKKFKEWAKVYGNVFSVRLGTELVVVLNSNPAIKEAFIKKSSMFSSRIQEGILPQLHYNKGILFAPWPTWKDLRKCCSNIFHELGMAKNSTELRIQEESLHLAKTLGELNGAPTDLSQILMSAVSNITCNLLLGKRFDYDDEVFKGLLEISRQIAVNTQRSSILTFIPLLCRLPLPLKTMLEEQHNRLDMFMEKAVAEHSEMISQCEPVQESFIGGYINQMQNYKRNPSNKYNSSTFSEDPDHLKYSLSVLFSAGTDTTATTLLWALLYLCLNQDIQENCSSEIKNAIGLENTPSYADKAKLPYVEAVLLEVQRIASIVPLGIPRLMMDDAEFYGYNIPKGAIIMPNFWAVHMNEEIWEHPEKFDPTRFLDDSGRLVNSERLMPFSVGPRDCLGSQLAKMEMFLFLTRLIQQFQFKLPDDDIIPSTEGHFGFVVAPENFKIIAVGRAADDQ
ncbi:cytochrome P450 2U1-like [Ptychodera flava]|uniref:cytochrome P450 2U1-like n=1 Tax=Ptychodera flava TaxID=63121 RepID=UPI00396A1DBA